MNDQLPTGWRKCKFQELFNKVDRKFIIDDGKEYDCVGVRWYGKGAFIRTKLLGASISRKQQWLLKAGDVVYNKLFAWKGAFAIADNLVDGCIVSDKFPTYEIRTELVNPSYLKYFFLTSDIADQAQGLSKGAAAISKFTLNPPQFWELTLPLPSLDEQCHIVEFIDALTTRISEAQRLRKELIGEVKFLLYSISREVFSTFEKRLLKSILAEPLLNGLSIPASAIGDSGVLFSKVGIVNSGSMNPQETKRVNIDLANDSPYWMKPDDIFVSRGNSLELVGRAAVYQGQPQNCAFPDLLIRIRVDKEVMIPKFLVYFFQSPEARRYIESEATGTSPSMKKISQPKLENMLIPILPINYQNDIIDYLDGIQAKVRPLKVLQAETKVELDALMPGILDRAFKGEL